MSPSKGPAQIDYDDPKYRITPVQQAAASCTGALLTSVIMTPLDVVKIRIQAQQKATNSCFLYCNGLMDHICSCQPMDPIKPWYKRPSQFSGTLKPPQGLSIVIDFLINECGSNIEHRVFPTLLRDVPFSAIYWMSYESIKSYMGCDHPSFRQSFIGGAISGSIAATITVPFDVVKTHQQIEFGSDFFSENGKPAKRQ
uniref:Uncharacterized protein n=1 Tax=Dendroctonus ponderosae TaxID=77166 RepID=A0AAR5P3B8_DENPD